MTEKEYYEIHTRQEEFLDWVPGLGNSLNMKNQVWQWIWYFSALSKEKSSSCWSVARLTLIKTVWLWLGFMDGEDAAHAYPAREWERSQSRSTFGENQAIVGGDPERDPRGWTLTIAHLVYLPSRALDCVQAGERYPRMSFS